MSSRADNRRRDRSWEREDRERDKYPRGGDGRRGGRGGSYRDEPRRRSSRSRSPRRDRDDRRGPDRRDRDYRRDDDRRPDSTKYERYRDRDRRPDDRRRTDDPRDSRRDDRDILNYEDDRSPRGKDSRSRIPSKSSVEPPSRTELPQNTSASPHPNADVATPKSFNEDGETMEEENDDDAAMMAMMGVSGFGSTKGKHVAGNQEGSASIKKVRTWRQYMNRRGGFNRPLDKIK